MTPEQIVNWIDRGGVVMLLTVALVVMLVGLYRGWWYPATYVRELESQIARLVKRTEDEKAETERWQRMSLTLLQGQHETTRTVVDLAQRVTGRREETDAP